MEANGVFRYGVICIKRNPKTGETAIFPKALFCFEDNARSYTRHMRTLFSQSRTMQFETVKYPAACFATDAEILPE